MAMGYANTENDEFFKLAHKFSIRPQKILFETVDFPNKRPFLFSKSIIDRPMTPRRCRNGTLIYYAITHIKLSSR